MKTKKMYLTPRLISTGIMQKTNILAGSLIHAGGVPVHPAKEHDGGAFPWEESGSESKEGYAQQNW